MKQIKEVKIGNVWIGGQHPVAIQSMLNANPSDIAANIAQAKALAQAGCKIIRIAIPNQEAISLIAPLKSAVSMPIVADIHFDYKLALSAIEAGIDKIRLNPGNIGTDEKIKAVVDACKEKGIPIRIGVNSGSLEKHILEKYGKPTPEALCESALYHVRLLEQFDFDQIVISMKSSDVKTMISAYELVSSQTDYPLHLGVTEAGTEKLGIVKSSIGIGSLLAKGIGNTMRVSLTADPVKEIAVAKNILKALSLHEEGAEMISCPTCGRTKIDLISLANAVEKELESCTKKITVAVMGCAVNGPGEAKEADIGIAAGVGEAVIFKKGIIIKKVKEADILSELMKEIETM